MASLDVGKAEACAWVRDRFGTECRILDVGACDGKWRKLLAEYEHMDAVEAFWPNARNLAGYNAIMVSDVCELDYGYYDLVIFGDVLEHMTIENAQKALRYAEEHSKYVLIGVPFLYEQGELYGNPYERHIQDDLTPEIFDERYPGCDVLVDCWRENYCYYTKRGKINAR